MTVLVKDDGQLNALLGAEIRTIVEEVTERVLKEVVLPSVQRNVYDEYIPKKYDRQGYSGGFIGSWEDEVHSLSTNVTEGIVQSDPTSMNLDSDNFIHGSNYYFTDDVRDYLIEYILGKDYHSGDFFGHGRWTEPRDFWSPIEDAVTDGTIDDFFQDAFLAHGLNAIKG